MTTITNAHQTTKFGNVWIPGGNTTWAEGEAKNFPEHICMHGEYDSGGTWKLNFYNYTQLATGSFTLLSKLNVT